MSVGRSARVAVAESVVVRAVHSELPTSAHPGVSANTRRYARAPGSGSGGGGAPHCALFPSLARQPPLLPPPCLTCLPIQCAKKPIKWMPLLHPEDAIHPYPPPSRGCPTSPHSSIQWMPYIHTVLLPHNELYDMIINNSHSFIHRP